MYCNQNDVNLSNTVNEEIVKPVKYCKQGDSKTYQIECTVNKEIVKPIK